MNENPPPHPQSRVEGVGKLVRVVSGVISIGTTILTLIRDVGGPVQFLAEVAIYGVACYVAIWVILPPVVWFMGKMEEKTKRDTSDSAVAVAVGLAVLGGGAAVRFGLFHDEVGGQELDAVGSVFAVLFGTAILLLPLFLLWHHYGSKPRS